MSDEKVVNFTGPRQKATPIDVEEMVERVKSIIERIENGDVVAITYALIRED